MLGLRAHVVGGLAVERLQRVVGEWVAEPLLDLLPHALRAAVVDHELEARFHARDAVAQVLLPRVEERPQDGHRLVDADPDAEVAGDAGHRREAAADEHGETGLAVAQDADERDAVDLGRVAAVRAGRDRDLVLARQVGVVGVAVEERGCCLLERCDVEQLVMREAGDGAAGQVAHGVAAGADGGQPGGAEAVEDDREGAELEVVELDRLAGGQLPRAAAVLVRQLADDAELLGRDAPGRQLDPEHERPDLRLVVVEAPPLEPDEILLVDVGVPGRDQCRQLAEHGERALLALEALHRVALQHEVEGRGLLHRSHRVRHQLPPRPGKRRRAPVPGALNGADGTCASPSSRSALRVGRLAAGVRTWRTVVPVAAVSSGQFPRPLVMVGRFPMYSNVASLLQVTRFEVKRREPSAAVGRTPALQTRVPAGRDSRAVAACLSQVPAAAAAAIATAAKPNSRRAHPEGDPDQPGAVERSR